MKKKGAGVRSSTASRREKKKEGKEVNATR
jgi:hypothetical protein